MAAEQTEVPKKSTKAPRGAPGLRLKREKGEEKGRGYDLTTVVPAPTIKLETRFKQVDPKKVKTWDRNARKHDVQQLDALCRSISEFGFVKPVVLDEDERLLAGHGACAAANLLKLKRIPAVIITGLSEEQKRAYVIADNRLGEKSSWDLDLLNLELADIQGFGIDLAALGYAEWKPEQTETEFKRPDVSTEHECPKCGYKF